MARERGNVGGPIAQRRHRDRKYVQPVEQILAKAALLHIGDQVAIGGGDDAHIHFHRFARANRFDFAFLNGAQELDLRGRRQFADFVEEKRAAGGLDEFAGVPLGGAGERALLVAEQNRLDQIFRHRAAIDRDERLAPPLARAMDGARHQFLADAGLARDQHRNVRGGRLFGDAQHSPACPGFW